MARRQDHSRDELRNMAIDIAEAIINTEGLKRLNARKIAAQMGYSVGTLYLIFGSMDELILAVNQRTLAELESKIRATTTKTPFQTIESMVNVYVHYALHHTTRWLAVFEYPWPEEKAIPEGYQQQVSRLFTMLESALEAVRQNSPVQKDYQVDVTQEARALWASIHGLCTLTAGNKLNTAKDLDLKLLADILVHRFVGLYSQDQ